MLRRTRFVITALFLAQVCGAAGETWDDYQIFQWKETRARFGIGANYFNANSRQDAFLDLSLRYRLSPAPWPLSDEHPWHLGPVPLNLWLEAGGVPPHTGSSLRDIYDVHTTLSATTSDTANLRRNWEAHAALGGEIPLGKQRWIVPDVAVGLAAAYLKSDIVSVTQDTTLISGFPSNSYSAAFESENNIVFSPYYRFGLNLFADRMVSIRLSAAHVDFSNLRTHQFNYSNGVHAQTFDLSASGWEIIPMLEIKWIWPSAVHVPLIPQALPPWLLPSYTTEPISPWVAPSEVAKDPRYNRPGQPSVGNVMFQYKNRWVEKVELVGDFNDWAAEPLMKDRSGIWVLVKDLPPGKFHYNYIVNGSKEILDPWNKNVEESARPGGSSVVVVK